MTIEAAGHTLLKFLRKRITAAHANLGALVDWAYQPVRAPEVNGRDLVQTIARLGIWAGLKVLSYFLRAGNATLDILTEASADLGEMVTRRRGEQT
jgi:hypothetical protein